MTSPCVIIISGVPVHQCNHVDTDEQGNQIRCENLTRSKTDFCHSHALKIQGKQASRNYYHAHKEKILKEKKLANLTKRSERIIMEINNILSVN